MDSFYDKLDKQWRAEEILCEYEADASEERRIFTPAGTDIAIYIYIYIETKACGREDT